MYVICELIVLKAMAMRKTGAEIMIGVFVKRLPESKSLSAERHGYKKIYAKIKKSRKKSVIYL